MSKDKHDDTHKLYAVLYWIMLPLWLWNEIDVSTRIECTFVVFSAFENVDFLSTILACLDWSATTLYVLPFIFPQHKNNFIS